MKLYVAVLLGLNLWSSSYSQQTKKMVSVDDAQRLYIGKKVIVNVSTVGCWHHVAEITAITGRTNSTAQVVTNALGEKISTSSDPEVTIMVRCPEGKETSTNMLVSVLPLAFALAPQDASDTKLVDDLQRFLNTMIGNTYYPRETKAYYSPASSQADLDSLNANLLQVYVAALEPLKVEAAKAWLGSSGLVGIVKLSSAVSPKQMFAVYKYHPNEQFGPRISEDFYSSLPSCWVKGKPRGYVTVGASASAIICQMGEPDKLNTYGPEDEQWVYVNADQTTDYLYVKQGKLVGLQHQDR